MDYHMHGSFIVLKVKDTFLFIQREDNGLWELPGGGFNSNETDYRKVALREMEEETGIVLDRTSVKPFAALGQKLKKSVVEHYGGKTNLGFVFLHFASLHEKPKVEVGNEHTDYRFFGHEEILYGYEKFSSGPLWMFFTYLAFLETGEWQDGMVADRKSWKGKEYVA